MNEMEILIGEDWKIKTDEHNFILEQKKVSDTEHHMAKESSKIRWINKGYYPNYSEAIKALVRKNIQQSEISSLEELQTLIERTEESLIRKVVEV